MATEQVTLMLDAECLAALRALVVDDDLSAVVDAAIAAHLHRLRHFAAVDEWLPELEREHDPVPEEMLAWAAQQIGGWKAARTSGNE